MNPNTGELRRFRDATNITAPFELIADKRLAQIASHKLGAADTAQVNLRSQSPLALWAKKKRKARIAAASRRRNRK